jgi:hypothetical protein
VTVDHIPLAVALRQKALAVTSKATLRLLTTQKILSRLKQAIHMCHLKILCLTNTLALNPALNLAPLAVPHHMQRHQLLAAAHLVTTTGAIRTLLDQRTIKTLSLGDVPLAPADDAVLAAMIARAAPATAPEIPIIAPVALTVVLTALVATLAIVRAALAAALLVGPILHAEGAQPPAVPLASAHVPCLASGPAPLVALLPRSLP